MATDVQISDAEVLAKFPRTPIDYDNLPHYRAMLQRKLMFAKCEQCGHWIYPPRKACPKCWSTRISWAEVSGKGTVWTKSIVYQGQPVDGLAFPFTIVAVELPEEPIRYLATMVSCRNEDVKIGMPVELVWVERLGVPAPAFQPAK